MHEIIADLHGHSNHSDGVHRIGKIINKAVDLTDNQPHILGLSDHDTISGWLAFLNEIICANDRGAHLLAIPGVEISTQQGHVLVSVPDRDDVENMLVRFRPDTRKRPALEVIQEAIADYHALCILVHPQLPRIEGISIANIEALLKKLTSEEIKSVGLEVFNWMTHIFPNRGKMETELRNLNQGWKLAEIGSTDYHRADHMFKGRTLVETDNFSTQGLRAAFTGRLTRATQGQRQLSDPATRVVAAFQAEHRTRTTRYLPK